MAWVADVSQRVQEFPVLKLEVPQAGNLLDPGEPEVAPLPQVMYRAHRKWGSLNRLPKRKLFHSLPGGSPVFATGKPSAHYEPQFPFQTVRGKVSLLAGGCREFKVQGSGHSWWAERAALWGGSGVSCPVS